MLRLPSSRGSLILANSPSALPIINPGYFASLHLDSSDAEIESRIRNAGTAHFHTVGTCAVGTVLDTEMRCKRCPGFARLRCQCTTKSSGRASSGDIVWDRRDGCRDDYTRNQTALAGKPQVSASPYFQSLPT